MDYDIDKIVAEIDFEGNELTTINNNILLTKNEINILKQYHINYEAAVDMKALIREFSMAVDEFYEAEDLEYVLTEISDRAYYLNTNK